MADFNPAKCYCFSVCSLEIWPSGVPVCGRRGRGEAHSGRRFHNGAAAGSATGGGAALQRLHPPTVKSKVKLYAGVMVFHAVVFLASKVTVFFHPVLLQQSPEYPNYQYLCKLCSVHIENIQGAHKHIKEKRHKKNITVWGFDVLLCYSSLPLLIVCI